MAEFTLQNVERKSDPGFDILERDCWLRQRNYYYEMRPILNDIQHASCWAYS